MPIYEFECQSCGKVEEIFIQTKNNTIPMKCDCGGKFKKIISQSSFLLKGSGWYATDYSDKNKDPKKKNLIKDTACNSCDKKSSCSNMN